MKEEEESEGERGTGIERCYTLRGGLEQGNIKGDRREGKEARIRKGEEEKGTGNKKCSGGML